MWRLALDPRIKDSLVEIRTKWTIDQALDAHLALDYIEALEREARTEQERGRNK